MNRCRRCHSCARRTVAGRELGRPPPHPRLRRPSMPPGTCSPSAFPAAPSRSVALHRDLHAASTSRSPRSPSASRTTGRSVSTGFSSAAPAVLQASTSSCCGAATPPATSRRLPARPGHRPARRGRPRDRARRRAPDPPDHDRALTILGRARCCSRRRSGRSGTSASPSASVSRPGSSSASTRSGTATRSARARYRRC